MADAKDIELVEDGNYFQAFVSPFTDRPPTSFYSSITIPSDSDRGFEDCLDCAVAYLKIADRNNLIKILSETTTALPDSSLDTESSNAGTPNPPDPATTEINIEGNLDSNFIITGRNVDVIRLTSEIYSSTGGANGGNPGGSTGNGQGQVTAFLITPTVLQVTFTATQAGYYSIVPILNSGFPSYGTDFFYANPGDTKIRFIQPQPQGAVLKVNWQQSFVYVPYGIYDIIY